MSSRRVVVVGMGVVSPNAVGVPDFTRALLEGTSGIRFLPELADLEFGCRIGAIPPLSESHFDEYFSPLERKVLRGSGIIYGLIAGTEAWKSAALPEPDPAAREPDWDTGCVFGSGMAGAEVMREATYRVDERKVRRIGSSAVSQVMASGISAYLGGRLGLGNLVTTNASACSTGTESILLGYERIKKGEGTRMVCGACDSTGPYAWSGFDAMRVTTRKHNECPRQGSRPMSASAAGFVPGGGAAALVLEALDSALERGATIRAEVLGGSLNSGGQRSGGTMTAPNPQGITRCIRSALERTGVQPDEVDAISGHLTATAFDPVEIEHWVAALGRSGDRFPYVNALKSMIGHCLSAAGAIEAVAAVLQLEKGFLHASLNCEDLHPAIAANIDSGRIPQESMHVPLRIIAKSSFGFGDVNACLMLKRYEGEVPSTP